jgi:hypothetical protein
MIRIDRGLPSDEELAALTAVLLAWPTRGAQAPVARSTWRDSGLPAARRVGPAAWRESALPR